MVTSIVFLIETLHKLYRMAYGDNEGNKRNSQTKEIQPYSCNTRQSQIPNDFELKRYSKEPIAFGLYSLICDFTLNDSEGQMDLLEEYIKKTEGVSEIQVTRVSRESVSIK